MWSHPNPTPGLIARPGARFKSRGKYVAMQNGQWCDGSGSLFSLPRWTLHPWGIHSCTAGSESDTVRRDVAALTKGCSQWQLSSDPSTKRPRQWFQFWGRLCTWQDYRHLIHPLSHFGILSEFGVAWCKWEMEVLSTTQQSKKDRKKIKSLFKSREQQLPHPQECQAPE